jgi:hypothetical protein
MGYCIVFVFTTYKEGDIEGDVGRYEKRDYAVDYNWRALEIQNGVI